MIVRKVSSTKGFKFIEKVLGILEILNLKCCYYCKTIAKFIKAHKVQEE